MKIIGATDFSEPSVQATRVAARLARRFGDELVVAHAWTSPFLHYREVITDPLAVEQKIVAKCTADLDRIAATLRGQGVTVETRLIPSGDPAQAIASLAAELNARMVVVGAHRGRTATRLFVGSAAERTVLLSDRPVLVVHAGGGLEEWADGRRPLRVAVGLDHSAASIAALDWVRQLRQMEPCDITFIHAFWPVAQYVRLGVPQGPIDLAGSDEDTMRVVARDLRPLFAEMPGQGTVELKVKPVWGSAAGPLLDEAVASKADLLVLGTHQRRALERLWVGSTVHPTLRMAELPVLCVPASETQQPAASARAQVRNVLVATDFSDLGNRAVAYAFELARDGGNVTLCHVRERAHPAPAYVYQDERDALSSEQRKQTEERLRALVPADADRQRITTSTVIIDGGHAATVIVQEANRLGADVICLGAHGRSGWGRAVLGSVAETVTRRAQRPVLIVRPGT